MPDITEKFLFRWGKDAEDEILAADPLDLDSYFLNGDIEGANIKRDDKKLLSLARSSLNRVEAHHLSDVKSILAVRRDLGILAGSLIRLGVNPVIEVEGYSDIVGELASVSEMSAFHTVYEYSTLNPSQERRRSFTPSEQEEVFISKVKEGMEAFFDGANNLAPLFSRQVDISDANTVEHIRRASFFVEQGTSTIPQVIRRVGGKYFAEELRPYFEPLSFDGEKFDAPGGAQMPIMLIDHMVWASDARDEVYGGFRAKNLRYLTPQARKFIEKTMGQPSLKTLTPLMTDECVESLEILIKRLYSFRSAHEVLARDSFSHRQETAVGSGGATPALLSQIKDITYSQI